MLFNFQYGFAERLHYLGFVTTTSWDTTRRLPTAIVRASGRPEAQTSTTQWHPTLRLPMLVTETGRTIATTYDAQGNALTETVTDTSATGTAGGAANSGSAARTWSTTYGAVGTPQSGLALTRTDPLGRITSYTYTSAGNLASITNPLGHITSLQYTGPDGQAGRMTAMTEPNGLQTTVQYDARGRVTQVVRAANLPAATAGTGSAATASGAAQQKSQTTYTPSGQVASISLPSGHQVSYQYDAAQRLTGATDNRGNRISYTLDAMGNRVTEEVRDANNAIALATQRAINSLNRVQSITQGRNTTNANPSAASSFTTAFGFDANGEAISSTDGLQQTTATTLDALRRPTSTQLPDNAAAQVTYNPLNQIVQATDPKGVQTTYVKNAFGEVLQETSPDSGLTTYTRDKMGNVLSMTDARGNLTRYQYDALDRPTQITQADGKLQLLSYDGNQSGAQIGTLREVTDPSGTTRYERDALGRITKKVQTVNDSAANPGSPSNPSPGSPAPTTYTTSYAYTSAGELAQLTYPSGLTVFYRRNATGQITALDTQVPGRNRPIKPFIAGLQYNALQMPTAWNWQHCTVPAGVTTTTTATTCTQAARQYDSAGRMTGNEFAAYGFDAASRINAITQNLYASLVSTSTATGTVTSSTSYYATPVSWSIGYDSRSRITSFNRINNPAGSNANTAPGAAGNAQSRFTYDPNSNRLTSINKVTQDTDLDGDFDQLDKASTTAQSLNIGQGTNKLLGFSQTLTSTKGTKTLATSSQQVNYSLDAAGNLTSDGLRTFDYDATNRHSQTTVSKDGEASKIIYLHNALGQRVFKSEPQTAQTLPNEAVLGSAFTDWLKRNFSWMYATAQTNATLGDSYVYADGNLPSYAMLGEYGNGGASSTGRTEYLYLPTDNGQAIPVGLFRGGRFYAVHADHLNTPRLINDDSNKAVWQWPYSAFGDNKPVGILKATTNPAVAFTQDPTTSARLQATNAAIVYNMRFAGQYQDTESGMFYNTHRSYLAGQGRYTQSDPIGLRGGMNVYAYAEGAPTMFTDPLGLRTEVIVWNGVGAGSSAFGHVSTNINGQNFSWAPGGWDKTYSTADAYNARQSTFRGGKGFTFDLTTQEEVELAQCLRARTGGYNAVTNNCAAPPQGCLPGRLKVNNGRTFPSDFADDLGKSPGLTGTINYPAPPPPAAIPRPSLGLPL